MRSMIANIDRKNAQVIVLTNVINKSIGQIVQPFTLLISVKDSHIEQTHVTTLNQSM